MQIDRDKLECKDVAVKLYGVNDEKIDSIIKINCVEKKRILVKPLMEMMHLVPRGSAVVLAPRSYQANNPTALPPCDAASSESESGNGSDGSDTDAQVSSAICPVASCDIIWELLLSISGSPI